MESRLHFRIHAALNSLKGSPAGTPWHSETTPNAARVRNMNPGIFLIMERFRCVWGWEITSTWTRFFCITSNMLFYLNFPYLFMYFFKALNDEMANFSLAITCRVLHFFEMKHKVTQRTRHNSPVGTPEENDEWRGAFPENIWVQLMTSFQLSHLQSSCSSLTAQTDKSNLYTYYYITLLHYTYY